VGITEGDLRGDDHRILQAAVDYVTRLGGGTVHIGPGRYHMRNALRLRENVRICGVPGKTILVACNGLRTRLAADGDCNEKQITVEDPSGLQVGDGIAVLDDHYAGGFEVTTATLIARVDERTFRLSAPLYLDYLVSRKATARLAFPIVGGWNVRKATLEGLTIEGNCTRSEKLDGCRAGGIYLFGCEDISIRHCTVHAYNGDGISFQVSQRVTVEDCLCEANTGLGLHPGSGSQHPVLRRNRALNNGGDGLFVCWRVKHGLFEDNEVRGNKGDGISIGHKDTDNLFRNNIIAENKRAGVLFRAESEPMGAHRNVFEGNRIVDNGLAGETGACVILRGHHHDVVFRKNTIGHSRPVSVGVGILSGKDVRSLQNVDNQFPNVGTSIQVDKR
jgi:parallel beta-helix repeat protein